MIVPNVVEHIRHYRSGKRRGIETLYISKMKMNIFPVCNGAECHPQPLRVQIDPDHGSLRGAFGKEIAEHAIPASKIENSPS